MKKLLFAVAAVLCLGATIGGPIAVDGATSVDCDLPAELRVKNEQGTDGLGLCVWACLEHSARYQRVETLEGVLEYMRTQPGGGWPERVEDVVQTLAKLKGRPQPGYLMVEGEHVDVLIAACKSGRMPGVNYGWSPSKRYSWLPVGISHFVSLVYADGRQFAELDNNFIDSIEWMDRAEFDKSYSNRGAWAVILLDHGPPPVPFN